VAYGNDATQRNDASTVSLGVTPAHPAKSVVAASLLRWGFCPSSSSSLQWQAGGQTYDL
jgi:hypothetical protein